MTIDVGIGREITLTFPTPVLVRTVPDAEATNAGLERIILAREAASAGVNRSNAGGWHSEETLLEWPEPEIAAFRQWVDAAVRRMCRLPAGNDPTAVRLRYTASAWANVNRNGDFNKPHVHPGCHWAVVYYVAVGEEEPGREMNGVLQLRDPRPAAIHGQLPGFSFGRPFTVRPKPGMLVVFPAWIEHWVHPFYGTGARISIATNVTVTKYEVDPKLIEADAQG